MPAPIGECRAQFQILDIIDYLIYRNQILFNVYYSLIYFSYWYLNAAELVYFGLIKPALYRITLPIINILFLKNNFLYDNKKDISDYYIIIIAHIFWADIEMVFGGLEMPVHATDCWNYYQWSCDQGSSTELQFDTI